MKKTTLSLTSAITLALVTGTASADSWDLTQSTVIGSNTTITQTDSTAQSIQAINAIRVGDGANIKGNASQEISLDDFELTLLQDGSTANSTQAGNYATGSTIGDNVDGAFAQNHSATGDLNLNQFTTGDSNTQAMNFAEAATELLNLEQRVTSDGDINLHQSVDGSGNIQAVNRAKGKVILADQHVEPDTKLTMTQSGAGDNEQYANSLDVEGKDMTEATQTVISTDIEMTQTTTGKGTQAGNSVSVANITTKLDQSMTGDMSLDQSGVGTGSLQAGNYLLTTGTVADVSQELAGESNVSLAQTGGETNILQAGNLLDASSDSANITNASQAILAFSGALNLTQTNTDTGAMQAGNALLTGVNVGVAAQEVDVETLSMLQTGTSGSIQAANYAGVN